MSLTARDVWGDSVEGEVSQDYGEEGHVKFYKRICVGGRDERGLFEYVLDGPATGEKVYINE